MSFGEFLSKYYTYIFILVILVYNVLLNRIMLSKVRGKFITLIVLAVLETMLSGFETWYGKQVERSIWRSILSTACYILRPTIMYVMLLISTKYISSIP